MLKKIQEFFERTYIADILEKIIEECARIGVKEFKRSEFQFEGISSL